MGAAIYMPFASGSVKSCILLAERAARRHEKNMQPIAAGKSYRKDGKISLYRTWINSILFLGARQCAHDAV